MSLALLSIVAASSCASLRFCDDTPPPLSSSADAPQMLISGQYEIEFRATGGTSKGNRVSGQLTLMPVDPGVRRDGHPLYGWLNADLNVVDAPLCPSDSPAPNSGDPLYPGVLVTTEQDNRQVLVVANAGNKYTPGFVTLDGCGIILYVDQSDRDTFSGRWGAYGVMYNGCGYFNAKRSKS